MNGQGFNAGLELVVTTLIMALGGLGLDRWLGTAPLFMVLGLVVGMVASLWHIHRTNSGSPDE